MTFRKDRGMGIQKEEQALDRILPPLRQLKLTESQTNILLFILRD